MSSFYKDVNFFYPKESPVVTNVAFIRQQVSILLNTCQGEVLFDPNFGIDLDFELFDLMDEDSATMLLVQIFNKIEKYCPNIIVDKSSSQIVPDADNHTYNLELNLEVKGADGQSFTLTKSLSR